MIKSISMFDLERMKDAMESRSFRMPTGLSNEQKKFLFILASKNEKLYSQIESLSDEGMKGSIKELMYAKKEWDSEILSEGGISYYELQNPEKRTTSDGKLFKAKYRVSCTKNREGKLLKFRVKTPSDEILSVQSKTCSEAQSVVDSLFGKGMFRVSQMLY